MSRVGPALSRGMADDDPSGLATNRWKEIRKQILTLLDQYGMHDIATLRRMGGSRRRPSVM